MSRARAVLQTSGGLGLLLCARELPMQGSDGLLFLALFAVAFGLIYTAWTPRKGERL